MAYKAFVSYSHAADNQLAPMLQSALQRFAKPFYKLRAIDIFRDKTSLHLTNELWPDIQKAIGQSEFFILMASPESAKSPWVQKEVDEWLTLKQGTPTNLLLVLTDGSLEWNDAKKDFDEDRSDALPHNLRGKFKSEPFFSDLRWVRTTQDLSLRHPRFLDEVGTLGATLHGRPKDKMIGEDVKQHRILKATAAATLVILLFLAAGASVAAYVATQQRKEAQQQTKIANDQRGIANEQRGIAEGQQKIAERERDNASTQARIAGEERDKAAEAAHKESIARTNAERAAELERQARLEAEANLRLATARQLAAQSGQALIRSHASSFFGADDPQRGVLLALESLNKAVTPEGTRAVRLALATLEGNETPLTVDGNTLSLEALGPHAEWAVVQADDGPAPEAKDILIDPRTGKEINPGPSVKDALKAAAETGEWRVELSEKRAITVWTTGSNRPVISKYEGDSISQVAISRDGSLVAAAGAFGDSGFDVRIWEVKGWRHIADLPHEWNMVGMRFSADGKWLTTVTSYASMDAADAGETALVGSSIRVWNVRDQRLVMHESLAPHGGIQSWAFSPEGLWLATTSRGFKTPPKPESELDTLGPPEVTILRLWQLTPDDLRKTACSKLKRNLSDSEWATFIGTKRTKLTCPSLPVPEE